MSHVDLNRLRRLVLENQRRDDAEPEDARRRVFVDQEGHIVLGSQEDDEDGRVLSEVHQGTFAARKRREP
jgi:hypothetical protein